MKLYKYRNAARAIEILEQRTLWFAPPSTLNDPFDCVPVFTRDCSMTDLKIQTLEVMKQNDPAKSEAELDRESLRFARENFPISQSWFDGAEARLKLDIASAGVFSASESWTSLAMWGLYGDSFSGACLELETDAFSGVSFVPVKYDTRRPRVNLIRDWMTAPAQSVSVKNSEWSFEQEHRMVLKAKEKGPLPREINLPSGALTGVMLGPRMSGADRDRLLAAASRLEPRPQVWRVELSDTDYAMERVALV